MSLGRRMQHRTRDDDKKCQPIARLRRASGRARLPERPLT